MSARTESTRGFVVGVWVTLWCNNEERKLISLGNRMGCVTSKSCYLAAAKLQAQM